MYYGSDEFNNAIENTQGNALKTRLKFSDEEIIELVSSMRYYGGSNDSDDLMVGNAVSAYVDVTAFTDKSLAGREFLLESGVKLSDGTYEYAPIGYFTVQTPNGDYDEVSFTAYDRMIKFEKVYSSGLTYPTNSAKVLNEICTMCGVTLATPITNPITITESLKGYTCREVLGYIAGIHGFFACIDRFGELNLRWYSDTPIKKSLRTVWAFEKSQEQYEVEKVEVAKDSETAYTSGTGIITLHHSNPYATQEIANSIYAFLGGYSYMPAEIEMLDDIRIDPWDVISVTYYDGIAYNIPCMSITHDFGGASTTVKAVGKTSSENEYRFTGPTIRYLNRMATDLLVANRVIATKVDAEYVQANAITVDNLDVIEASIKSAVIKEVQADFASIDYLEANYADIQLANVEKADIGTLLASVGLIDRATIVNGHVTGYLDSVEVNANKITTGTLAVDRLVFRGENSIIYELNNVTGALQAVQGNTLNGEILTNRSITVDKIVANSITANEIAARAITASELATNAVTADKILANAITTAKIASGAITADKLSVDSLSAITADLGTVTAGTLKSEDYVANTKGLSIDLGNKTIEIIGDSSKDFSGLSELTSYVTASTIGSNPTFNGYSGIGYVGVGKIKIEDGTLALNGITEFNVMGIKHNGTTILGFSNNGITTPKISTDLIYCDGDIVNAGNIITRQIKGTIITGVDVKTSSGADLDTVATQVDTINSNLAISKNFWTANTSYVTVYVGTMVYNAYECSLTINVGLKTSIAQYNSLAIGTTSVKPPLDIVTGLVTTNGIRYQLFITAGGNIQIQAMSGAIASGDSIAAHIKYFVA